MTPCLKTSLVDVLRGAFAFAGAEEPAGVGVGGVVGYGGGGLEEVWNGVGRGMESGVDGLKADTTGSGGPVGSWFAGRLTRWHVVLGA